MLVDHIGYAVKKLQQAQKSMESLGFQFGPVTDDDVRNVRIAIGVNDGCRVELVTPLDGSKESPVDSYLEKVGPAPYHICYSSEHFFEDIEMLRQRGFRMVIEPREAIALGGRKVAFLTSLSVGLIEIAEKAD